MYERLLSLYLAGRLSDAGLDQAVTLKWITADQAAQIRAAKAANDADVLGTIIVTMLES